MKELICEFNLFDLHQRIFIFDPATRDTKCVAITTLLQFPEVISELSDKEQIYNIHLFGHSSHVVQLKEQILTYNAEHYNHNKIKIEVN